MKTIQAVEFYNQSLDHYFLTTNPDEIAKLDEGKILGWKRTGQSFNAYPAGSGQGVPVARFYNPRTGSHFYSASQREIADVQSFFHDWQLESNEVFRVDEKSGTPVYRLFNNRTDANHRYTTDAGVRDEMVAKGYTLEGPAGGIFFAPTASAELPQDAWRAEMQKRGFTPDMTNDVISFGVTANYLDLDLQTLLDKYNDRLTGNVTVFHGPVLISSLTQEDFMFIAYNPWFGQHYDDILNGTLDELNKGLGNFYNWPKDWDPNQYTGVLRQYLNTDFNHSSNKVAQVENPPQPDGYTGTVDYKTMTLGNWAYYANHNLGNHAGEIFSSAYVIGDPSRPGHLYTTGDLANAPEDPQVPGGPSLAQWVEPAKPAGPKSRLRR